MAHQDGFRNILVNNSIIFVQFFYLFFSVPTIWLYHNGTCVLGLLYGGTFLVPPRGTFSDAWLRMGWGRGRFAKFFSSGKPLRALCHCNTLEGRGGMWLFRGTGQEEIRTEKSPGAVTKLLRHTRFFTHGGTQHLVYALPCQARVELARAVVCFIPAALSEVRDIY